MSITEQLAQIQQKLKCPKSQYNSFGSYNYRNCEDILTGLKKVLDEATVTLADDLVLIGERYYIKATATYSIGTDSITATAFAREPELKKGMDASQITGAASSYARKYALCGLFALDDNRDADSQDNTQEDIYTEAQKELFDKAIKDKDPMALWALKEKSSEDAYLALYGSFAPGTKTENKKLMQQLEPQGQEQWDLLVTDILKMIDNEDTLGLDEQVSELTANEKRYLMDRLGEQKTKQLTNLVKANKGKANNE